MQNPEDLFCILEILLRNFFKIIRITGLLSVRDKRTAVSLPENTKERWITE